MVIASGFNFVISDVMVKIFFIAGESFTANLNPYHVGASFKSSNLWEIGTLGFNALHDFQVGLFLEIKGTFVTSPDFMILLMLLDLG